MKFEKFIKRAGINAVIVTDPDGDKWIYNEGVAMLIPPVIANNYGDAAYKIPVDILAAINEIDTETTDPAELIRAEIPADGKAKEITRIYANADFEFCVCNTDWALIERSDKVFIAIDSDNDINPVALAIYSGDRIVGIIFPLSFTRGNLEKIN